MKSAIQKLKPIFFLQNRLFRVILILTLSVMGLTLVPALLFWHQKDIQKTDGKIINIAGRQRMLSQKITKTGLLILSEPSTQKKTQYQEILRSDLKLIQQSHEEIMKNENPPLIQTALRILEPKLKTLSDNAYALLGREIPEKEAVRKLLDAEPAFLKEMHEIVNLYEADYNHKQDHFRYSIFFSSILNILVLLLMVTLVILPEIRKNILYNRRLQVKNQELEQFVYIASHDLQEPLKTIHSFTQIFAQNQENRFDEENRQMLGYVLEASSRMSLLIKGLLDYGRLGRKKELTLIDCQHLIHSVLKDLTRSIQEAQAMIFYEDLPLITGYEFELRMLFQNLLSNAIKFRKPGNPPVIRISAQKESGYWKFSIEDNGIGIDPAYGEKIFSIFQRLHQRGEYEGIGIGLAHCRKIVSLHQGKIWVQSVPGKGSVFYFTLKRGGYEEN